MSVRCGALRKYEPCFNYSRHKNHLLNGYNNESNIKNDIVAHREVKCYIIKGKIK